MVIVQQICNKFGGDTVVIKKMSGWATAFCLINIPPVNIIFFVAPDLWKQISVLYLVDISILALALACWSVWQTTRVEVRQEEIYQEGSDE